MKNYENEFQQLYGSYYSDIFRFLLKWTDGNETLAEELTQETFFQVFLSLHRYRGDCKIKTWICQIAKNVSYKYFEKHPQNVNLEELLNGNGASLQEKISLNNKVLSTPSIEEDLIHQEDLLRLRKAIKSLKKKYRNVIIYRTYFELSFQEIGEIMKISPNSAKVLYHRGKEKLRIIMKK